jgi:uncharacterized protein
MPLEINLRHLAEQTLQLKGELPVAELELDLRDEMVRADEPLAYDLEAQELDQNLLVQGSLRLGLRCQCVRCLKSFRHELILDDWTCLLPLAGSEKVAVVNDCVDLTPIAREDILLEIPQHPLCNTECGGLPGAFLGKTKTPGVAGHSPQKVSAWAELDKLKFKN